jgi:hypothetical protein
MMLTWHNRQQALLPNHGTARQLLHGLTTERTLGGADSIPSMQQLTQFTTTTTTTTTMHCALHKHCPAPLGYSSTP